MDAGTALTAYRVVQESLTNIVKHAGRHATVRISVDWTHGLTVTVTDDGTGVSPTASSGRPWASRDAGARRGRRRHPDRGTASGRWLADVREDSGMSTDERIRVALVDDQELMRSALRMTVESQPDLELVGEASDGHEALALVRSRRVDVVLMDLRMPRGLDGIKATEVITGELPDTRVVALTTYDLDEYAFAAIRAGASAFLLKDARSEEIIDAIRVVHAGHAVVAPSTTRRLIEHLASSPGFDLARGRTVLEALTPRESQVLQHVATGATNAEIAEAMHLSGTTVKTHVGHVLAKLGLRDRVQAVVLAYESGLVRPGE